VVVNGSQMHVIYRDRVGALQDVYNATFETAWTWQTLPISKFAAGDPIGTLFGGGIHVCYRDRDGNICDSYFAGSWAWLQLTGPGSASGGPQAIGDPMPATYGSQLHVLYCDINSNLSDAYWDGQWRYVVRI
jgi:hypothetical protein